MRQRSIPAGSLPQFLRKGGGRTIPSFSQSIAAAGSERLTSGGPSFSVSRNRYCMSIPAYLRVQDDGVLLSVKLQPRASANEISGPSGNELRVRVTAPPVDNAANEALIELLADALGCGRNRVELVRGQGSRHKLIRLHGFSAEEVLRRFDEE
jgi:uncharacterized protein (TIGR00251 family)